MQKGPACDRDDRLDGRKDATGSWAHMGSWAACTALAPPLEESSHQRAILLFEPMPLQSYGQAEVATGGAIHA